LFKVYDRFPSPSREAEGDASKKIHPRIILEKGDEKQTLNKKP